MPGLASLLATIGLMLLAGAQATSTPQSGSQNQNRTERGTGGGQSADILASNDPIILRIGTGDLAIVGLTYHLADGRVVLRDSVGEIGE